MNPSAWARIDGCPQCVHNTEAPRSVMTTDNGYLAAYLCADCGHAWMTSWSES
jgi:hypothetical protein